MFSGDVIYLYEGNYDIVITDSESNFILPVKDVLTINDNISIEYQLSWSKVLYQGIDYSDWIFLSGDWLFDGGIIKTQSSSFYPNDY